MDQLLKVSAIQMEIAWEDKKKNMSHAEEMLKQLSHKPDIIIFPEMFLTGFSMHTDLLAESMDGEMVRWMKNTANRTKAIIIGSLPIIDDGKYFNRLLVVYPHGDLVWYDKRHLFRMGEEPQFYTGGKKPLLFDACGWSIKPLVCYDLRFPVWSRNKNLEYSLIIYVANWPAARDDAFVTLLKARAIENQSYVIGVNRVGTDGNGIAYKGNSVVYNAMGKLMNDTVENRACVINVELSMD